MGLPASSSAAAFDAGPVCCAGTDGTSGHLHWKGHGELTRETFGPTWAWVSVAGLAVVSIGALLTETYCRVAKGRHYSGSLRVCLLMGRL